MIIQSSFINNSYEQFYAKRAGFKVYPTEFVVRTFLAKYPSLHYRKPEAGDHVLDVALAMVVIRPSFATKAMR